MTPADLDQRFAYHPPADATVAGRHEAVRSACRGLAELIDSVAGDDSREKSLAVTKVEEAMMWANAAIARHQPATT